MEVPTTVEQAKEQLSQLLRSAEEQAKLHHEVLFLTKQVKVQQWKSRGLQLPANSDAAHAAELLAETVRTTDALAYFAKVAVATNADLQWVLNSYLGTLSNFAQLESILAEAGHEIVVVQRKPTTGK
jgi:hypothetical protein